MLFENLELHEIKAGPGSSDVTKEDHSEISWKLKRLNTLYLKKNYQILSQNYSIGIHMSNSGSESETYESSSESGLEGDYSDFHNEFEE